MAEAEGGKGKWAKHPAVLSTIISLLTVFTVGSQVASRIMAPWMIGVVKDAIAADTNQKIEQKMQPVTNYLEGMAQSRISELDDAVKLESFRKSSAPTKWTQLDELKLAQLERRLAEERAKLNKLLRETNAAARPVER